MNETHDSLPRVHHMDELGAILNRFGISPESVCVVGGSALALAGIRENNDVDIVLRPEIVRELGVDESPLRIGDNVDLYVDWGKRIGITDEDLIDDPRYHTQVGEYRSARPEVVFAYKNARGYPHDRRDVELVGRWALSWEDWNWGLCPDPVSTSLDSAPVINHRSYLNLLRRVRRLVSNPTEVPRSVGRRVRSAGRFAKRQCIGAIRSLTLSSFRDSDGLRNSLVKLLSSGVLSACPTARLVGAQYVGTEFNRYDLAVRWLAVDEYFGGRNVGWRLYNKMQDARGNREESERRFRSLIESVHQNGLDDRSSIEIDAQGRLGSGSHRLALALYLGIPFVQVRVSQSSQENPYGLGWFEEHGFSDEELRLVREARARMFEQAGLLFHMLVWPPAISFFREIAEDLEQGFPVVRKTVLEMSEGEFHEFVQDVYRMDDIAEWKVARKLWGMDEHAKRIGVVSFEVPEPRFRAKTIDEDVLISVVAEELKKKYRERYRSRIPGYFYDISLHIGDNYHHNREISRLLVECGAPREAVELPQRDLIAT